MAETVVSFLVGEIGVFLKEEIKLQSGVRGDIEDIRYELEHIKAFLRAAEAVEEPNSMLNAWINEVRDIAFEMEDVLAEFRFRLEHHGRVGMITRFLKNVKYRHEIASKLQAIKSRIIKASERRKRYELNVPEQVATFAASNIIWNEQRGNALLLEEAELVGIDEPKRKLIQWLVEEDAAFKVISVVGMGGLGKTTLVKKVYDDAIVQNHFNNHAWITVSQSFKIEDLLKDIIRRLFKESGQATPLGMETMKSGELKDIIKKFLQGSRYLVVLDDVWQVDAWDAIIYAFPQSVHGNRVMLTTRNQGVADVSLADSKGEVYSLEPLSFEMCWKLFCRKTFKEQECPQHLKDIGQSIVRRCEGLPLAVVAISGVLSTKRNGTKDEWEMVKRNLGDELQSNKIRNMNNILSLSYYDLPFNLKACLLYISLFPEDYEVGFDTLTKLWIAERFVEDKEGKTMEEVAESYLNELIGRSLIQVASTNVDDSVRTCRIHDLLREVIVSKSADQSFTMIINEKNTRWNRKARRLSVQNILGNMHDRKYLRRLRSLLVFGVDGFPLTSFCNGLKLLNALDLRGTNLEIFPNEITKMYHLRYLSLRDSNVREIPDSIGKLQNLETLNLIGTPITKLPATIVNLAHLRHLWVCRVNEFVPGSSDRHKLLGFEAISKIGCLKFLQALYCIEAYQGKGINIIEEVGRLKQLRELGIVKIKSEDSAALCSSIEKLTNLRRLFIHSVDDEEAIINLQHISSPPQFLRWLEIVGRLEKVPQWITSLHNLTALTLINSRLREDELKPIQDLPSLLFLQLWRAFDGEELCFKIGGFQKLKKLWLVSLPTLRRVEMEIGAMPFLEQLWLVSCANLEKVPLGIENLVKLKHFELGDVSDNLINRIDRTRGGEDFQRVEHIPIVNVFHARGGEWVKRQF